MSKANLGQLVSAFWGMVGAPDLVSLILGNMIHRGLCAPLMFHVEAAGISDRFDKFIPKKL